MTRAGSGKTKVNTYFDDRILEGLRVIAAARGTTYSELIRVACREFVLKEGGKVVQESVELKKLVR
jgi:hypothetical protein